MAGLTRKFIKDAAKDAGVELPAEMIDAIIGAHVESRDAAIEAAVNPLNELLEAAKGQSETDEYKTKWEQEHEAFEKFKGEVEAKELNGKKQSEIKNLLKELNHPSINVYVVTYYPTTSRYIPLHTFLNC